MFLIRDCRLEDYEAVAAVAAAVRPEPMLAEEIIDEDRRGRLAGTLHRLVAENSQGRVIGYAFADKMPWHPPGEWGVNALVHPEYRRRGAGQALYQAVERIAREGGATTLSCYCRSDDPENFAWAERRGFVSDLLRTESVLDLADWNPTRFAGHLDKVRSAGIRLEAYDGDEPERIVDGIWDLERLTSPDVPDYEPDAQFPTIETYKQMWYEYKDPRFTAVALDGDRVVGASFIFYSRKIRRAAYTGYTAVLREYRGRGLALALKLLTVEASVERGVPRMRTNNDFENPSMLAVNTKLGYQLVPGPRRIKRTL